MTLKERLVGAWAAVRKRAPLLDHLLRTHEHYASVQVNGSLQAGGITYFAFLSVFPILALSFFVVGYVADIYPDAAGDLTKAIDQVLPGMVGDGEGQISLDSIRASAGAVGIIGLLGVIYSGLGWLSAMRTALQTVFEMPKADQPNFVFGKLRDLATLAAVGLTLVLSVSISGAVTGYSERLLDLVGLGAELRPVLAVVTIAVGLLANMVLFFLLFTLLARPGSPRRALWSGALLGAIGFEALKWASSFLLGATKSQPAFQAFGIALILLVWINYFSRVVLYAAAWAHTSSPAVDRSLVESADPTVVEPADSVAVEQAGSSVVEQAGSSVVEPSRGTSEESRPSRSSPLVAYAAGAASTLAAVALLRRKKDPADADH